MKKINHGIFVILSVMILSALTFTACAKKQASEQAPAPTQAETAATTAPSKEETTEAQAETAPTQTQVETVAQAHTEPLAAHATFNPSDIHDLVSAEAVGEFGSVKTDNFAALRCIEGYFKNATKLNGWPNCPYDMIIRLTRNDGQVFEFQPATDSCDNLLIGGNDWYCFNNGGTNEALFDLFNLQALAGNVTKRAPLPAYEFPGDDGALKAVTEYCAALNASLKPEGSVVIPECVFLKKEDDGNGNVKVYGNFWTHEYSKFGNALFLQSGGTEPGIAYLKKTGDNTYEVVKFEQVGVGDEMEKDIKRFCNGNQSLYDKYMESLNYGSDLTKIWRNWHLSNYIKKNNLNIEYHQQYGWKPEKITPIDKMPELMK